MAAHETDTASVADEAARLAEAFAGWAGRNRFTAADFAATDRTGSDPAAPTAPAADAGADPTRQPVCDCAHGPGVEAVCRNCPVCRAAGLLQAVSPELLDRAADLLDLLAGGLHAAAAGRRPAGERDGEQ